MRRTAILATIPAVLVAATAWAAPNSGTMASTGPTAPGIITRSRTPSPTAATPTQKAEHGNRPANSPATLAVRPPTIENPRITCDRWPSNYDAQSWIRDVWRLENARSGEQKVLALYKWVRLMMHWGQQCYDGTRGQTAVECDAIKKINIYPYGECSDFGVTAAALGHAGGLRTEEAHLPEHTQLEAFYKDSDGVERWHRLDPFWGIVVYDKSGSHIATWQEIKADPGTALRPARTVQPWGDKVTDRQRFADKAACEPDRRVRPSRYTMDKPLYAGETYILSWERLAGIPFCNANPQSRDEMDSWGFQRFQYADGDPAKLRYGHELLRPFIETVEDQLQVRQAHGTLFFKPLLTDRFADSACLPPVNVKLGANERSLCPAVPGKVAELVYLVQTPYVIANAAIAGNFRTGPGDQVKVSLARGQWRQQDYTLDQVIPAVPQWHTIWQSSGQGRQLMRLRDTDLGLRGEYKFLVKVEMTAAAEPILVGMDQLGFVVRFQEGVMALPRLLPGKNVIRVTAGRMQPGYSLHVTYIWDDTIGKEREAVQTIDGASHEFEIQAAGTQPADVRSRAVILQAVAKDEPARTQ